MHNHYIAQYKESSTMPLWLANSLLTNGCCAMTFVGYTAEYCAPQTITRVINLLCGTFHSLSQHTRPLFKLKTRKSRVVDNRVVVKRVTPDGGLISKQQNTVFFVLLDMLNAYNWRFKLHNVRRTLLCNGKV